MVVISDIIEEISMIRSMRISQKQSTVIDTYIATFPRGVQDILKKLRQGIKEIAPEAEETIKYGIPTFQSNGKNVVHFAAFKNHIGFYPTPPAIVAFKKELSSYKQAKGSVQFPLDRPIPYSLVKKIVEFRMKGNKRI